MTNSKSRTATTAHRDPTDGALRAARAIVEQTTAQVGLGAFMNHPQTIFELAGLITEHTADREMLTALQRLLEWNEGIAAGRGNHYPREHADVARAAIRSAVGDREGDATPQTVA